MLRSGFTVELGELRDSLESSKLRASVIQFGKKKIRLGPVSFFSRCPGSWGKLERKGGWGGNHLSTGNYGDLRKVEAVQGMESGPFIFQGACPPACCITVSARNNSFLSLPAGPHNITFHAGKQQLRSAWEQHHFCAGSPVPRCPNHFQDSISPVLRILPGGRAEARIVLGLFCIQYKQDKGRLNDLSLVRCESEAGASQRSIFILNPLFCLDPAKPPILW